MRLRIHALLFSLSLLSVAPEDRATTEALGRGLVPICAARPTPRLSLPRLRVPAVGVRSHVVLDDDVHQAEVAQHCGVASIMAVAGGFTV